MMPFDFAITDPGAAASTAAGSLGGFDISQALQDPAFNFGANLFGAARSRTPLLDALRSNQEFMKMRQNRELQQAQLEQYKQHSKLYGQQVATAENARLQQQRALEGISKFMQKQGIDFPDFSGGGNPAQPPALPSSQPPQMTPLPLQGPAQAPQALGPADANAPPQLAPVQEIFRSKIIPIESKGQHWASPGVPLLGPVTKSGERAVGIAQVMPSTGPEAAKLAGLPWDENRLRNDPAYNAALGEAYFAKQMQDFGRPDYAAAAYNAGPGAVARAIKVATDAKRPELWMAFLPKETQAYITNTVGTAPEQPAQAPQPPAGPLGLPGKGVPLAAAGAALELAGVKGGKSLIELGKMMQPDNVPAGSYQRNPQTGELKYVPNPVEEKRLTLEERRVAADERRTSVDEQKAGVENAEKTQKINIEAGKATQAISNVNASMDRLEETARKLRNHPGLNMITGVTGGLINPRLLGEDARNAAALLETLKAQVFVQGTTALRAASATGAGVGNQSDKEGDKLEGSMARLSQAQSYKEFQDALDEIVTNAKGAKQRMVGAYEQSFPGKKYTPPRTITRSGVDAQGRRVNQYSDGTIDYAN